MKRWMVLSLLMMSGLCWGQAAPRYVDDLNGFSLQPPTGTERLRETSPRRLVAWVKRDEKTQAVNWTLEILKIRSEPTTQPLAERAKIIAQQLRQDRFMTEEPVIGTAAGKPSADFRGLWKGTFELWRRQTWVQVKTGHPSATTQTSEPAASGEYLVLEIYGPVTDQVEMDATLTAVDASLQVFDPASTQAQRRENLIRGQNLLESLKAQTLEAAIAPQPYYFTLTMNDKPIGLLRITESIADRSNAKGLMVVRAAALHIGTNPRQLTREELFATPSRNVETWKRLVVEGEGATAVQGLTQAIKQEDLMVVTSTDTRQPTRQKKIPQALAGPYLPAAFDVVLTRLLDRNTPGAYGFAVYNASINDFDLRTVKVVAPTTLEAGAAGVSLVHLQDQVSADAPVADLWVDAKGNLIQMRTADGLVMQRIDAKQAAAAFAQDVADIDQLEKKAR